MSPYILVLGLKCPNQFGISTEVSLDTSTGRSVRHWYRNGLIPKCLDTEVSGNPGWSLFCGWGKRIGSGRGDG